MSLQTFARGGFLVPLSLLAIPLLVGCNERVESAPPEETRSGRVVSGPESGRAAPREVATAPGTQAAAAGSDARLFVGWPEPRAALVLTGEQHGYIEPCGCTGLVNQKGGLNRRHTLVRELAGRGWNVVPLDVGNQVRRVGRQAEIKFQMTIEGLKRIGYRAIGFGPDDLQLSVLELVALAAPSDDQASVFVSANATILDPTLTQRYQIIQSGDVKIGVTAIVQGDGPTTLGGGEISLQDPAEALREVVPKLEEEQCDLYVLLAHTSLEKSRELAEQFPLFRVVATAGGMGDPTYEAERVGPSDAMLVQVGIKAMYVGVVGLFDDPEQPLRYQRVPLDSRFADSTDMLQLLASYQEQLQQLGLEGLGLRPIPYSTGRSFIGSESCKECHSYEYDVWKKSGHSHALDSLVHPGERSEVPRHFDPECISCHVVGWNPQQYYPYATGYLGLEATPKLHHVGCETCHGPGAEHAAAESGDRTLSAAEIDELRLSVRLPLDQAERKCMECHDLDNSPDFQKEGAFDKYWKEIEH